MSKSKVKNTKIAGHSKHSKHSKLKIKRYITIDALRGFAVVMMVFVSTLYIVAKDIPFYLLHNQGDALLFFDLVAPIFQFVLGMSLFFFILHREAHGFNRKEIMFQILWRYLLLIILGFVLDAISYLDFSSWGVLETLGVGGIIAYFISDRTNNEKILISILILSVYSFFYYNPIFMNLIAMPHGGPIGALSYSVISIIGFMTAKMLYKRKSDKIFFNAMLKYALILMVLGILLNFLIPFNKAHASPSFIIVATGIVIIFYLLFFVIYKSVDYTFDHLRILGRAALSIWVAEYVIGWIFFFIIQKTQFIDFIPGLLISIIVTIFMYFVAIVLNRMNLRISF